MLRHSASTAPPTGLIPDLRDLQHEQDGSEIKSRELELITDRAQNLSARRDAFEKMRDAAAEDYPRSHRPDLGGPGADRTPARPASSPPPPSTPETSSRARKDRKTQAHLPEGTLVAVTGGKDVTDPAAVFNRLDKVRAKYTDILFSYLRHEVP